MHIECPSCGRRFSVEPGSKDYQIVCDCSERLTVLPWVSFRQTVSETKDIVCSVCGKKYDPGSYRNNTEIACACGNVILLDIPDPEQKSIGRRKADHASQQLQTRLHGLVDTTRLIHFVRDIDKLLLLIVRVTSGMLDSEGCSIILRDPESKDLMFHSVTGEKSSTLSQFRLAEGEGVAGQSIQKRESIVANDVATDARFSKRADDTTGFLTRNLICTPLIVDDMCIGALEAVNKNHGEDYTDQDVMLAEAVSNQIAVAIHNVQLTEAALKKERLAAVGEAITGVAHCVKNMLQGLEGSIYVFRTEIEDAYDDAHTRGFDMLGRNLDRLKGLVQDMLTYSKDREPEYELVDVNDLARSVVDLLEMSASESGVELVFNPDENAGQVEVDQRGIYRCILNLVTNGIGACEEHGSVVVITTKALDSQSVLLEVSDNGLGMDEDTMGSIFQPFFSMKGSRGTGLGLSVTQKIISEHGGAISVSSNAGEGSTFSVQLPRSLPAGREQG